MNQRYKGWGGASGRQVCSPNRCLIIRFESDAQMVILSQSNRCIGIGSELSPGCITRTFDSEHPLAGFDQTTTGRFSTDHCEPSISKPNALAFGSEANVLATSTH